MKLGEGSIGKVFDDVVDEGLKVEVGGLLSSSTKVALSWRRI